jgi:hypothetical protein
MAINPITATFNGAQPLDGDFPYVDITWPTAYASASAYRIAFGANLTDGNGALSIFFKNKAGSGVRVCATDQFTGTVELTPYDV